MGEDSGAQSGWAGEDRVASRALSRLGPPRCPGTALLLRLTSENKHVPQAAPVPRGPAPASTAAAGSKPALCPPAAPAAQAILISVWVCAGKGESKPSFFQQPRPDPRLRLRGSPGLRVPLPAAAGSGALLEPVPRVRTSPFPA